MPEKTMYNQIRLLLLDQDVHCLSLVFNELMHCLVVKWQNVFNELRYWLRC